MAENALERGSVVTLGGREFQVITNGPVKHDYWMAAELHKAGIDRLEVDPTQSVTGFVDAVLDRLMETGTSLVILGGMLAPADLDLGKWTPSVAAQCTAFIESLMSPDDKRQVRGMIAEVVAGFFRSGLASLTTSRAASPTSAVAQDLADGEPIRSVSDAQ